MNNVILMGRLTKDPIIAETQSGKRVARYTLAVDRDKDHTDFISCVTFDRGADFAQNWLRQGVKILVAGRITTGSYTNRDGQKVFTTDVIVDRHEFVESKGESKAQPEAKGEKGEKGDGFMTIDASQDDGLPWV